MGARADGGRYGWRPAQNVLILMLLGACLLPPSVLYARALYMQARPRIRLL